MGWGRAYFAAQAFAGAGWWVCVFASPVIRTATLGRLDPILVAALDIPLFVVMSALAALGARWAAVTATVWTAVVAAALAISATLTSIAGFGAVLMIAAAAGSVLALLLLTIGRVPTERILVGPLSFGTADPGGSRSRHVRATALQILVFWGLFLGLFPVIIAAFERRWALALEVPVATGIGGIAVFVLASALGIWAAVVMSTRGAGTPLPSDSATLFVIGGPYRFVRNPMALAAIVQGAAIGLVLSSWLVVVYAVCGSLVWNHLVRPEEERDLEERFGGAFVRYRDEVRCWWPRLRPVAASVSAARPPRRRPRAAHAGTRSPRPSASQAAPTGS